MNNIRIALLQLLPTGTVDGNLKKGIEYCRLAKEKKADIALFPEMWSNGYKINDRDAVSHEDSFVTTFSELAKELDMAIGITYLEKFDPMPRNTFTLFDRFGEDVLTYAKVHTCDFDEECRLTPGDDFHVAELDIDGSTVKVGAMICYDREFPESARILMLKGAELILVPNACPMEINRISQLRARAYENMLAIATVNYPKGYPDCNGHSTVFDGIAYKPGEPESRDTLIIDAGEEEGVFIAVIPIDEIRDYREREVHGNAYRHPCKYKLLISEDIDYPFVRKDYRRLT